VLMMAAMWPSIRNMPGLQDFLKHYPPALRKVFRLETYATGSGYLNAELFSLMVPAMFLVFGIGHGARLVAGEEEDGTLEVLVTVAPSRHVVIAQKAVAFAGTVALLGVALFGAGLIANLVVDMHIGIVELARGTISVTLLGLQYGLIAFAIGAGTGRRGVAIGAATGIAIAMYMVYILGQLMPAVRPWQGMSSFSEALGHGPIGAAWSPGLLTLIAVSVAVTVVGGVLFDRRDLRS